MKEKSIFSDRDGMVTIFYNAILFKTDCNIIEENCPKIRMSTRNAVAFADSKVESKEWARYTIPELTTKKIIFEEVVSLEIIICLDPLEVNIFERMSYTETSQRTWIKIKRFQIPGEDLETFLQTTHLFEISNKHYKIFIE